MTDNHGYETPAAGTLDWHKPLNRNFERLDADAEIRDTDASRSNYVPKDGAKFLATDTGDVYLGDGSAWNAIGSISGSGGTGGDGVLAELIAGNLVALASGLSTPQVIDPSGTDTPVQDGLDILGSNGGGEVRLPPTTVTEVGPIKPYTNTAITGFGDDVSKITITGQPVDGIQFARGGVSRVVLTDFALNGPGPGAGDTGVALHHVDGDTQDLFVGRMIIWGWNNSVYRVDKGVGPFQCRHELITIYECDAGARDGLFEFRSWYGPANWFGTIAAYPSDAASGQNTTVFFSRGGTQIIEFLTMGGSSGIAVEQTWDSILGVGNVHWEPTTNPTSPPAIVRLRGYAGARVGTLRHITGTADYAYELADDSYNANAPARKMLGPYFNFGSEASLSENVVSLSSPSDASMPSLYEGAPGDVDVTHSGPNNGGLRALGDAGTGF